MSTEGPERVTPEDDSEIFLRRSEGSRSVNPRKAHIIGASRAGMNVPAPLRGLETSTSSPKPYKRAVPAQSSNPRPNGEFPDMLGTPPHMLTLHANPAFRSLSHRIVAERAGSPPYFQCRCGCMPTVVLATTRKHLFLQPTDLRELRRGYPNETPCR